MKLSQHIPQVRRSRGRTVAPRAALVLGVVAASLLMCGGSAAGASTQVASPTRYRIVDLGSFGGPMATARAINARGEVVGWATTRSGFAHAFYWYRGRMVDLGTLGGATSYAYDINDRSEIVGHAQTKDGAEHMVRWTRGRIVDLGVTGWAFSVNSRGTVVGARQAPSGGSLAVLLTRGHVVPLTRLGIAAGASDAVGVNDRGQIVGSDARGAYRTTDGHVVRPSAGPVVFNVPRAVNAAGDVAGFANVAGMGRAALWRHDGSIVDLGIIGTQTGMTYSEAYGLNDRGQVVGVVQVPGGALRAFVWSHGRMTELGVVHVSAMNGAAAQAINDAGQIVGTSAAVGDFTHAVMWVPIGHR